MAVIGAGGALRWPLGAASAGGRRARWEARGAAFSSPPGTVPRLSCPSGPWVVWRAL
ncbi:hypothetical protein [Streptomyces anulatus]|uniref:hypothetical protein n=1 Tax=Streptomyces anulatus TaxID=1892 RepID=UPI000AA44D14|nr:hypothetical protein [Streptomyces anulatus]